jgi:Eukaryotic cytochrome b561
MTNVDATRQGHAIVMSLVFLVLMPFAALTLYLPYTKKVPHLHAPLQILSIILVVVGLALGVRLAKPLGLTTGYHQIIGYIIVAILFSAQPILGLLQHLHFRKTGTRSSMGLGHQWLGRIVILLGVVNGGLGMMQSGPVGNSWVPNYAPILYSIVAAVMFLIYIAVVVGTAMRKRTVRPTGKYDRRGYEMHPSGSEQQRRHEPQHYR